MERLSKDALEQNCAVQTERGALGVANLDTVCVIIIGSGNYLIIGTSAILINSKAEPCHVNELPIPLVCQKRVKRALRAHQALKGPFQSLHTDTLG